MKEKRVSHACMVDSETDSVYVMGGEDRNRSPFSTTEILKIGENQWKFGPELKEIKKKLDFFLAM